MRILHISDLHFGDHNRYLKESLEARVSELKPDLILATGDIAENPDRGLLDSGKQFLLDLGERCSMNGTGRRGQPRVIVVPGNHDVRYLGNVRLGGGRYREAFRQFPTNHYFGTENVWVYGFDSSSEIWAGANGKVSPSELQAFENAHNSLSRQYPERFPSAFKIVVLHHHPVPIKYSDKYQRWLTLVNAGEFLARALDYGADLVLHGHEHTKAFAIYGRESHGRGFRQVPILSVGAALKNNPGPDHNRFNLITIESDGSAYVDCYGAEGNAFDPEPWEPKVPIRTVEQAKERHFEQSKTEAGHCYSEIASVTLIDDDGDGRRIVECDDLTILNENKERAANHKLRLPETSGYIDLPSARAIRGDGLLGLHLEGDPKALSEKSPEVTINYGRKLKQEEKISYQFEWWAVNAFAMNERESRFKYGPSWPHIEFTHYVVNDAIEDLIVIVQYPDDFNLGDTRPEPFVAQLRRVGGSYELDTKSEIQQRLSAARAIRYIESMKIAALRVHRPDKGYSYGVQWKLPPSPPLPSGPKAGQIEVVRERLLAMRKGGGAEERRGLLIFLRATAELLREQLIPDWGEHLEVGLQIFDPGIRKIVVVGAGVVGPNPDDFVPLDCSDVEFEFGEGIGGKVFKTNEPRLYVRVPEEERKEPDFHRPLPGGLAHAVLLAMPVRNPDDRNHVYAVLNLGSASAACPLRDVGEAGGLDTEDVLTGLQEAVNDMCFEKLSEITTHAEKDP